MEITAKRPGPQITKESKEKDALIVKLRKSGKSFRAIAGMLNLNVRTVYDRYKRALGGYPQV